MPFYEYECPHCGYRDEVLQAISDAPLKKCPNCGKNGLRKLMSAPVFRLKGSGWYETDFKSDKENKRNLAGADKEDTSEKKVEAKTEAKPEAKADAKADAKVDAKPDTAKSEPAKPARDKPASQPVKRPTRAKARHKTARTRR
jgi:putative FmdB family regulatory protein